MCCNGLVESLSDGVHKQDTVAVGWLTYNVQLSILNDPGPFQIGLTFSSLFLKSLVLVQPLQ